jgi:hypothetical protein
MFSQKFLAYSDALQWSIHENRFSTILMSVPWNKSPLARHEKYVDALKQLQLGWNEVQLISASLTFEECETACSQAAKEFTLQRMYDSLTKNPKLSSTLDSLQEVQEHFEQKQVSMEILDLYQKTLKCEPWEVMCFLLAVHLGKASEFTEIPSALLCQCRGLPYRSSSVYDLRSASRPSKMISKPIAFLVSTADTLSLFVKNENVASVTLRGYPVVIPTTSTTKQRVILLDKTTCKVLSVTAWDITEIGEFEVEADGPIGFMDAFTVKRNDGKDYTVLQWGGGDSIRGNIQWSYCAGLDDRLNFFEVTDFQNNYRHNTLQCKQDFTLHGNLLSLRADTVEAEENGIRKWTINQSILCEKTLISGSSFGGFIDDVWGTPQQHLILSDDIVFTIECGSLRQETEVTKGAIYVCGLYALSRVSGKKNPELQNGPKITE